MAGAISVTATDLGGGVTKYLVDWTSDASGDVTGQTLDMKRGWLFQARFIPDAGGTQPSDDYDVTLLDADGVDVLQGGGTDRDNATPEVTHKPFFLEGGTYVPVVDNAGNAKGGKLALLVGPFAVVPAIPAA
jgi:hypothetical protein